MSNQFELSPKDLAQLRETLQRALTIVESAGGSQKLHQLLHQCVRLVSPQAAASHAGRNSRNNGSILYTVEDEACEPYGRELDIRIYFDWNDRDPSDQPSTPWGAVIRDLEVLAVRYFDEDGSTVPIDQHHVDVAWDLVESHRERIEEKCSEEIHSGTGIAGASTSPLNAMRMAPSVRERPAAGGQRKHG